MMQRSSAPGGGTIHHQHRHQHQQRQTQAASLPVAPPDGTLLTAHVAYKPSSRLWSSHPAELLGDDEDEEGEGPPSEAERVEVEVGTYLLRSILVQNG